jgi:TM2 domain-containing membrane protein YozV
MQMICRRCQTTFAPSGPPGTAPLPCPRCGALDVATMSPMAATAERPTPSFSAPVSQPVQAPVPLQAMPPTGPNMVPYTPPYSGPYGQAAPAYAPQQYPQQQQQQYPQAYPQAINVVIQNQINPYPMAVAPSYGMTPYVKHKDAGVATLLSFFLPGAGQLYNGQVGKGLAFLLVSIFVNFPLMFVGVGFFTALVTWIWAMVDAHGCAEKINRGEIVV